jgi:hypothetical protein
MVGLAASTTYYWQVRARNGGTTEANGGVWWSFTTSATSPPAAADDSFATNVETALVIAAPGVLGNDLENGGGAVSAVLITGVTSGTLAFSGSGGFTYTPNAGFVGVATFTYRATNARGAGNVATVTITVSHPTAAQPPTGLTAWSIAGNGVTLRWTAPTSGLTPTGYVVEGGINPGEVLASLSTGSASPIFSVTVPRGAFYIRVYTIAGASRSPASNEIRIFVDMPVPPSAPEHLLGLVNDTSLALSWKNTFAAGAPESLILDVTGPVVTSIPLGLAESFSFAGVPTGTYTFAVRATNPWGISAASNAVTLNFPGACSGVPLMPASFLAYHVGNVIGVVWDPPPGGPAPTGYVVNAAGAVTGSFPMMSRMSSAIVGPGSYGLSVTATNACGSSPATAVQTVTVP